jgi:hypothetical protein
VDLSSGLLCTLFLTKSYQCIFEVETFEHRAIIFFLLTMVLRQLKFVEITNVRVELMSKQR